MFAGSFLSSHTAARRMLFALHVIVMSSAFFNPSFAFSSHFDTGKSATLLQTCWDSHVSSWSSCCVCVCVWVCVCVCVMQEGRHAVCWCCASFCLWHQLHHHHHHHHHHPHYYHSEPKRLKMNSCVSFSHSGLTAR